jgi:hypothetical protein
MKVLIESIELFIDKKVIFDEKNFPSVRSPPFAVRRLLFRLRFLGLHLSPIVFWAPGTISVG